MTTFKITTFTSYRNKCSETEMHEFTEGELEVFLSQRIHDPNVSVVRVSFMDRSVTVDA